MSRYEGPFFRVDELEWASYSAAYPLVDVHGELLRMTEWLTANPKRRKRNYKRFIANWLTAETRWEATYARSLSKAANLGAAPRPSDYGVRISESARKRMEGK